MRATSALILLLFNPQSEIRSPKSLRPEALAVFGRDEEGANHLGAYEVAVELVELVEPEVVAVEVRVGRVVGVAAEVSEVFHQDERAVLLALDEVAVIDDRA